MSPTSIEDKLAVNKYDVDEDVHIKVDEAICTSCQERHCLCLCPADCYQLVDDHITFSHDGCLECGSCRIVCKMGAIEWILPRGGFGVCYEYG